MLYLCNEMEQINKICKDKQIPLLFLKGPVLAFELYGDISLRTSSDIDILVPINKLEKAENVLMELGFIKDDYIETILNDWKWRHHHVTYIHPKKEVKVEIHWRLNPGPGKEPSFQELWSRKRISLVTTNPIYFLGKEDLFLFLVFPWSTPRLVASTVVVGYTPISQKGSKLERYTGIAKEE